jgi:hypothetical protein
MTKWLDALVQFEDRAGPYRIEFICFIDSYAEPKEIETIDGNSRASVAVVLCSASS